MTKEIEKYFDKLWPLCRSISGKGLRESFKILQEIIPLNLTEVPTGTKVFDWTVPKEWNIKEGYLITPDGKKICDFQKNNLHIINYSAPIDEEISYIDLINHLHTLKHQPDAIPYITSYYKENWGFCLTRKEYDLLPKKGKYRAVIKSELKKGSLTYGDLVLPGKSTKEVLFSTYLCHPSMANNELSGPLCLSFLYEKIKSLKNRNYTYRFVVVPETIGTISYLSKNGMYMKDKVIAGYILTCCGDSSPLTYKLSKKENSLADRVAKHVLKNQEIPFNIIPFSVGGSDERQYCSPGFNMPVGSLMRSVYQTYKEYHTSLDNKSFISFQSMLETIDLYFLFAKAIELNKFYINAFPFCEPQLGKRNLYPSTINPEFNRNTIHNRMHLLSYSDGENDLIKIAELKKISVFDLENDVKKLSELKLILEVNK
jgi:aminopeptidase-like protein